MYFNFYFGLYKFRSKLDQVVDEKHFDQIAELMHNWVRGIADHLNLLLVDLKDILDKYPKDEHMQA